MNITDTCEIILPQRILCRLTEKVAISYSIHKFIWAAIIIVPEQQTLSWSRWLIYNRWLCTRTDHQLSLDETGELWNTIFFNMEKAEHDRDDDKSESLGLLERSRRILGNVDLGSSPVSLSNGKRWHEWSELFFSALKSWSKHCQYRLYLSQLLLGDENRFEMHSGKITFQCSFTDANHLSVKNASSTDSCLHCGTWERNPTAPHIWEWCLS
jgi:hypothetical protein